MTANELYERLERWGGYLSPLGMPGMQKQCRVRRLIGAIAQLADSLNQWADSDKSEAAYLARGVARVAQFTDDFARDLASAAVRPVEYADRVLANWDKAIANFQRDIERLWWTVDGWEFIILLWKDVEARDRDSQRAAVTEIYRVLPIARQTAATRRPPPIRRD